MYLGNINYIRRGSNPKRINQSTWITKLYNFDFLIAFQIISINEQMVRKDSIDTIIMNLICCSFFILATTVAKLSYSWQVKCQSNWELRLVFSVRPYPPTPPHPGKYIWSTSKPPWKLKFGIEALFNQTKSTSQLASHQLVSQICRG